MSLMLSWLISSSVILGIAGIYNGAYAKGHSRSDLALYSQHVRLC